MTHLVPCSVVVRNCFWTDGPCVKVMTTYSAAGAWWWVNISDELLIYKLVYYSQVILHISNHNIVCHDILYFHDNLFDHQSRSGQR